MGGRHQGTGPFPCHAAVGSSERIWRLIARSCPNPRRDRNPLGLGRWRRAEGRSCAALEIASPHRREDACPEGHALLCSRATLTEPLNVAGIRPVVTKIVESARVTAHLPDGRIEPLVWLYHFDPKTKITFRFRQPLVLPPGTVVESSTPLQFALEVSPDKEGAPSRPTPSPAP